VPGVGPHTFGTALVGPGVYSENKKEVRRVGELESRSDHAWPVNGRCHSRRPSNSRAISTSGRRHRRRGATTSPTATRASTRRGLRWTCAARPCSSESGCVVPTLASPPPECETRPCSLRAAIAAFWACALMPRAACRAGGSTGAVGLPVRRQHGNVVALPGHAGAPDRPAANSLDDDAKDAYLKPCCWSL
jgi:hypothetical protein